MANGTIKPFPSLDGKADKTNTVLETTLSRGRKANTNIGGASFAFGIDVTASGSFSHAEGGESVASGAYSHSEGFPVAIDVEDGEGDITQEWRYTTASGVASHAEGAGTESTSLASHAEGYLSKATGPHSHAEGSSTVASHNGCHAEGNTTIASGMYCHAEGANTIASGNQSHAEGYYAVADGKYSHAEGERTQASGTGSHAQGKGTQASLAYMFAGGLYNVVPTVYPIWEANHEYAVGDYVSRSGSDIGYRCKTAHTSGSSFVSTNWDLLPTNGDQIFVVGNGKNASDRSNAFELDWNGNAKFAGNIYVDGQYMLNKHIFLTQTDYIGRSGGTTKTAAYICDTENELILHPGDFVYVKFSNTYTYRANTFYHIEFRVSGESSTIGYYIANLDTYTAGIDLFKQNHVYQFYFTGTNFQIINFDPE